MKKEAVMILLIFLIACAKKVTIPEQAPVEFTPPETPLTKDVWEVKAEMLTDRSEVAIAAFEGKVYVFGGIVKGKASAAVETYDPVANNWTMLSSMPAALHHAAAVPVGSKIFVIGGYTETPIEGWKAMKTIFEYDPYADRWREKEPMPTPRGGLTAIAYNGKIYAIGGALANEPLNTNEVYDPKANSWQTRTPMPTLRDHITSAMVNGRIYVIGGREADLSKNLAVNEEYDPMTDMWQTKTPMPTARSGIASAVINKKIYVFGGESMSKTFTEVEAYDFTTNSWSSTTPMRLGRHGLGVAVVNQTVYVIAGGLKPGGSYSGINDAFIVGVDRNST
jgi:N-acetylneuraminic acid mutarotase